MVLVPNRFKHIYAVYSSCGKKRLKTVQPEFSGVWAYTPKKLVATYVISDDKAERISKLMVPQLSFEESVDPQGCVDRRQLRHRQETGATPRTAPPLHRRSTIPHQGIRHSFSLDR